MINQINTLTAKFRKIYSDWYIDLWKDKTNLKDRRGPFDSYQEAEEFRIEQGWDKEVCE